MRTHRGGIPLLALLMFLAAAPPADAQARGWRVRSFGGPVSGYKDPAFSRGHAEGYKRGFDDGRGGGRYDPVQYREYRDGDRGYVARYGSRDGYKSNYRDGFRQGYEEGYREGSRSRRR